MRTSEVLRRASVYLDRHGIEDARRTAEILLASVLGTDRARLYTRSEGLSASEARMYGRALCQRCAGTPLQHLTGEQAFRHLAFRVRPGVFIPRPETEVLVDVALAELGAIDDPVVVDVGTGTGAIGLSIKHERPGATVFATDLSAEAVALARENAARLGLEVTVLQGDLLDPLPEVLRGWVDLVVSNPPYVSAEEYEELPDVVRAEPPLALLGGTEVHRRLADEALRWLGDGGVLAMELGAGHAEPVRDILSARYIRVRVAPDLAGRDRIAVGRRP